MPIYVANGRVEKGELKIAAMNKMVAAIKRWRDCRVSITVEKLHAHRSLAANAYYWSAIVEQCSDRSGYDPNEMHDHLKAHCLPHDLAEEGINGHLVNGLVIGGSTAKLDSLQFGEYLEKCVRWAAENLEIAIQPPDPNWKTAAEEETRLKCQAS